MLTWTRFLKLSLWGQILMFWILVPHLFMIWKYLLSFSRLPYFFYGSSVHKLFHLMSYYLLLLLSLFCQIQKIVSKTYVKELTTFAFSSMSFMVLHLTFKTLTHFIFCVWCQIVVQFHFLHVAARFPNNVY